MYISHPEVGSAALKHNVEGTFGFHLGFRGKYFTFHSLHWSERFSEVILRFCAFSCLCFTLSTLII